MLLLDMASTAKHSNKKSKNSVALCIITSLFSSCPLYPVYTLEYTVYLINSHLSLPCLCQPKYLLILGIMLVHAMYQVLWVTCAFSRYLTLKLL